MGFKNPEKHLFQQKTGWFYINRNCFVKQKIRLIKSNFAVLLSFFLDFKTPKNRKLKNRIPKQANRISKYWKK